MGKKKQQSLALGRQLVRDRFTNPAQHRQGETSFLHTSELHDGVEWGRLNLNSVTEQTSLEDFLATAQMAGTEFTAERLNVSIVSAEASTGLLTDEQASSIKQAQYENKEMLRIPRRPVWDETTTPEELDKKERDNFLKWRRDLAILQEKEHILLTPFERNLDFWRQLWRVIERSDAVVQIVDGRNPLLFRSEDLETLIGEVGKGHKTNMILVNKADYLTQKQREKWARYFDKERVKVAFWSAVKESERIFELNRLLNADQLTGTEQKLDEASESSSDIETDDLSTSQHAQRFDILREDSTAANDAEAEQTETPSDKNLQNTSDSLNTLSSERLSSHELSSGALLQNVDNVVSDLSQVAMETTHIDNRFMDQSLSSDNRFAEDNDIRSTEQNNAASSSVGGDLNRAVSQEVISEAQEVSRAVSNEAISEGSPSSWQPNDATLLDGDQLVEVFRNVHTGPTFQEGVTTIGLVGYPNVGKSSTINALLQTKKVPVSATPGRTKHFQTLFLEPTIMLCDCPGLVMPSFISTKAEMVVNGILPIDQMRDFVPPVSLLCQHIPRASLEVCYGIMLPQPGEGEPEHRPPTPHELLGTYGCMRGYMTHKGIPDFQRSARCVLKDYVNGKLLYRHPPPGVNEEDYESTPPITRGMKLQQEPHMRTLPKGAKVSKIYKSDVDKQFFGKVTPRIGSKGVQGVIDYTRTDNFTSHESLGDSEQGNVHGSVESLAQKPWKRHQNRKKKEKLRRLNAQLDVY